MSFLDDVYNQLKMMHLPVSSNDVVLAMKNHESLGILSPAAKREKIRKALSDLKNKKNALSSFTDDAGILWWNMVLPKGEIHHLPEKLPELPKEDQHKVVRQLLRDIGHALLKAADGL